MTRRKKQNPSNATTTSPAPPPTTPAPVFDAAAFEERIAALEAWGQVGEVSDDTAIANIAQEVADLRVLVEAVAFRLGLVVGKKFGWWHEHDPKQRAQQRAQA